LLGTEFLEYFTHIAIRAERLNVFLSGFEPEMLIVPNQRASPGPGALDAAEQSAVATHVAGARNIDLCHVAADKGFKGTDRFLNVGGDGQVFCE